MAIIISNSVTNHIEVEKLSDLFAGEASASAFPIGVTAHVVDDDSTWICVLNSTQTGHVWTLHNSSIYTESRFTWETNAESLISGNAPTGIMRNRYPMLPLRSFSSDQLVTRSVLELDASGSGAYSPLTYGVDYGLLPRTPELVGGPGIGIGYGLQSRASGAGGPRSTIADQAVGFAVDQGISATLTPSSRFRFTWTERELKIAANGAKAGVLETVPPFGSEPSFVEKYGVAHAPNVGTFPNMPKQYAVGQFAVFFNAVSDCCVEIWRRPHRTSAGAYRDGRNKKVGLRRLSTGLTLLDRTKTGVFYGTMLDVFSTNWSHEQEYRWCYWSDRYQARSRMSDLPIFRSSYRWLTTSTTQGIFRSGNVFWVGLR
jgi:hypothetical protein